MEFETTYATIIWFLQFLFAVIRWYYHRFHFYHNFIFLFSFIIIDSLRIRSILCMVLNFFPLNGFVYFCLFLFSHTHTDAKQSIWILRRLALIILSGYQSNSWWCVRIIICKFHLVRTSWKLKSSAQLNENRKF